MNYLQQQRNGSGTKSAYSTIKIPASNGSKGFEAELRADQPVFKYVQQQQLEDGDNADGDKLEYMGVRHAPVNDEGTYSMTYSNQKSAMGGNVNQVDLKLTGKFQDAIEVTAQGMNVNIKSTDTDELKNTFIDTFYKDPIGLNDDSLQVIADKMSESLMDSITKNFKIV